MTPHRDDYPYKEYLGYAIRWAIWSTTVNRLWGAHIPRTYDVSGIEAFKGCMSSVA